MPEPRSVSPLDVLMGQALALRHMADSLILAIESMSVRPPAAGTATAPPAAAQRPPHGVAEPPAVIPPGQHANGAPRGFATFDGPVTIPGQASAPAGAAREIAPDAAGDLHPSTE